MQHTSLSEISEFELITKLTQNFPIYHSQTQKTVGDDCAVVSLGESKAQVITTDLLVEHIHFDLMYHPAKHLGYKAVTTNLSDVYAMNAIPTGIVVGIAIPKYLSIEFIEEIYQGIRLACQRYQIDLLGGDTTYSPNYLMISITAVGLAQPEKISYRSGANLNDLICVSGNLGAAYAGLQILQREKQVFLQNNDIQPVLSEFSYVISRQLRPEARKEIVERLEELNITPTAMIDISDGLSNEIHHICAASHTGAVLYADRIPIDTETAKVAELFDISPITYALNGGEDYELLFTVPLSDYEKIQHDEKIQIIGAIKNLEDGIILETDIGEQIPIEPLGFNHFKKNTNSSE
ncbi:MAG: thiamine-phosphate kinase [Bacteroidia bacterium]|nr:thiamine-phosphate kinase [Bacteroidia bacterium]